MTVSTTKAATEDNNLRVYLLPTHWKLLQYSRLRAFMSVGLWAVPWLRRLTTGLSPRRPKFAPGSIQWDLWWTKWHWDRFFSESFGFPPANIIPPLAPHFRKLKKYIVLSLIHLLIHSFILIRGRTIGP
jgi:hypothetical protein